MAARVGATFAASNLVVDNSAFQRGGHDAVRDEWVRALRAGRLYRTPILEFEVLYSARHAREHAELRDELEALRPLPLSMPIVDAALAAQSELAEHAAGFHRLPHQDYLVAAIAAAHDLGVLHYDADFDRLAERSSLAFESVWIAAPGALDDQPPDPLRPLRRAVSNALGQFSADRAEQVRERVLRLLDEELRADELQPPARPVEDEPPAPPR